MSAEPSEPRAGNSVSAETMLACAAAARARAIAARAGQVRDFLLPDAHRLSEHVRHLTLQRLSATIDSVAREIGEHAVRLLERDGKQGAAARLKQRDTIPETLLAAQAFQGSGIIDEILAATSLDLLTDSLPVEAKEDPDQPSLLVRLSQSEDRLVATAAVALMHADGRKQGGVILPAELHHRLVWIVAAALGRTGAGDADIDGALIEATRRSLAAHDEGDRAEAVAMRLALTLDPTAEMRDALMTEAVQDRRLLLLAALMAQGLRIEFTDARDLLLDREGSGLWVALRALDLARPAIARIGYALCEGDPARDVEQFAAQIDAIMKISPDYARRAIAPMRLDPDYRQAMMMLDIGKEGGANDA
ncbi:hypothetical protein GCM10023219_06000 [Stakelama sediminis]|uniref:DUF2336 domain-containing protein n=1 Tax=Stakelama sediminis TaxID=463200 RepID=A0A840YUS5_9SPHN|nr:DUF2336 domain-containing protein [Stakelama sediminis]MBB5717317.1 hypothetical protein [Stakelama sediminis]